MTFDVVNFEEGHYRDYALWLEARGRTVPSYELLDEGLLVLADGRPVAAGFVFRMGKICSVGNLASDSAAEGRAEAVDVLLNALIERARQGGHKMVVFCTNKPRLMKRLEDRGFSATDRDLVQYVRAF